MKKILLAISLFGALIATISSIFSATNKLYVEQADGSRKLLPTGYISITLTVCGLLTIFSSGILGYRNAKYEAEEKAAKDALKQQQEEEEKRNRRLEDILSENRILLGQKLQAEIVNAHSKYLMDESKLDAQKRELKFTQDIILSGQPLKSVSLSWDFIGLERPFQDYVHEKQQEAIEYTDDNDDVFYGLMGPRHSEVFYQIKRDYSLYSFFNYLCGTQQEDYNARKPVIVQMSFDEQNSAVLSFGQINKDLADWGRDDDSETYDFSGAIEYIEDFENLPNWDEFVRKSRRSESPWLGDLDDNNCRINWNLDPSSLFSAIDMVSSKSFVSSKLPERFRIMVFYDIERLPFEYGNLARFNIPKPYSIGRFDENPHFYGNNYYRESTLKLTFNGIKDIAYIYDVRVVGDTDITESFDPPETLCQVKIFECFKRNSEV